MKVSGKLDQGNNAAIFCSLAKEERREWVKDIIPELDTPSGDENTEGMSDESPVNIDELL